MPREATLPDHMKRVLAHYDAGKKLLPHELLAVQMVRNVGGCHACSPAVQRPAKNPGSAN